MKADISRSEWKSHYYSKLTKIFTQSSARRFFGHELHKTCDIHFLIANTRVGPIYEKFSDQALNWSKVVPWHEKQSEAIIFQLS